MAELKANVDNVQRLLEDAIWGDLDRYSIPWIKTKVTLIKPNLMKNDVTLEISVTIEPDVMHPEEAKSNVRKVRRALSNLEEAMNTTDRILETILNMAEILAPKLYEVDPRIGLPLTGSDCLDLSFTRSKNIFPTSPLFDPPRKNLRQERILFDQKRWTPICPFCNNEREMILRGDGDFYWGGGNINWVHSVCAPWIQHISTQPFKGNYGSD